VSAQKFWVTKPPQGDLCYREVCMGSTGRKHRGQHRQASTTRS
jgi:hypothetical protein